MTYVITAACADVKDKTCVEHCPVDCIYEGDRMMYINPDECIDCGACEPVCPTEAIYFDSDTPEDHRPFVDATAMFIRRTNASGGATTRGLLGADIGLIDS